MGLLFNWFLSDRRRRKLIRNCSLTTGSYLKWRWFFCLSLSLSLSVSIYRSRRCRSVTLDQNDGGGGFGEGKDNTDRYGGFIFLFWSPFNQKKTKKKKKRKEEPNDSFTWPLGFFLVVGFDSKSFIYLAIPCFELVLTQLPSVLLGFDVLGFFLVVHCSSWGSLNYRALMDCVWLDSIGLSLGLIGFFVASLSSIELSWLRLGFEWIQLNVIGSYWSWFRKGLVVAFQRGLSFDLKKNSFKKNEVFVYLFMEARDVRLVLPVPVLDFLETISTGIRLNSHLSG